MPTRADDTARPDPTHLDPTAPFQAHPRLTPLDKPAQPRPDRPQLLTPPRPNPAPCPNDLTTPSRCGIVLSMSTSKPTRQSTPFTRAVDAAEQLTTAINEMSFDSASFAEVLATQHRTLQQSTTAVFLTTILRMAENGTDDRNEAAVCVCRVVRDALIADEQLFIDRNNVVRFPFI